MDYSIAICAYGHYPALLERCLTSVIRMTVPCPPIILCLNAPSPQSLDLARQYIHSLDTLIVSKRNIGIEGAIHLALRACRTEAMIRLDDDSHVKRSGWFDILRKECEALPATWGALGRMKRCGFSDELPGQGYVSRPWVRNQPWYRQVNEHVLAPPPIAISGGFCVLNVAPCVAVDAPPDSYPAFEEDHLTSLMLRMADYTLHESDLITNHATGPDAKPCSEPFVAVGDAPSRTRRDIPRQKWKGIFV